MASFTHGAPADPHAALHAPLARAWRSTAPCAKRSSDTPRALFRAPRPAPPEMSADPPTKQLATPPTPSSRLRTTATAAAK
ncbi:unnamed protein product [Cutaneotrichosporon oleaginosum]